MAEEYREYRRSHNSKKAREPRKSGFSKKLLKQLIISFIIFVAICGLRSWGPDGTDKFGVMLKNAFTYRVDTSGITEIIENIINAAIKNPNTEVKTNEFKDNTSTTQDI